MICLTDFYIVAFTTLWLSASVVWTFLFIGRMSRDIRSCEFTKRHSTALLTQLLFGGASIGLAGVLGGIAFSVLGEPPMPGQSRTPAFFVGAVVLLAVGAQMQVRGYREIASAARTGGQEPPL